MRSKDIRSPDYCRLPRSISIVPNSVSNSNVPPKHVTFRESNPIVRRVKEPDKFDGKSIDWHDYIVHFEQTASWNRWSKAEKAQQLCMSLRGTAQKLLCDARVETLNRYSKLNEMLGCTANYRVQS